MQQKNHKVKKRYLPSRDGFQPCILWFTGLPSAGKSTIASAVHDILLKTGVISFVLDADVIRQGLNKDLGFTENDRHENIRRIGEVAKLLVEAGAIALVACISPYQEDRLKVRQALSSDDFIEVYVKCSLETCESRDPKGLYRRARAGEIPNFTGIDSPYEVPENADVVINTDTLSVQESARLVFDHLGKLSQCRFGESYN